MNNFSEKLCATYKEYGYSQYKMSKFEEYDLYVKNKDFLVSDNIITFTDLSGKLMALKPDVTLSIIKNSDEKNTVTKVYYDENVYRVEKGSQSFKEIKQVGLECFGDIDDYCLLEVLKLAAKTLSSISSEYKLDISNLSILTDVLDTCDISTKCRNEILRCMGQKNLHEMAAILKANNVPDDVAYKLQTLAGLYGAPKDVLPKLKELLPGNERVLELEKVLLALDDENAQIDFSVVNDIHYYNGIVFNGFVNGVADSVLSGGQYDNLMSRLKRDSKAVGFALYVNMLEDFFYKPSEYDVDVLIIYNSDADLKALDLKATTLREKGQSVLVVSANLENIRAKKTMKFEGGELIDA